MPRSKRSTTQRTTAQSTQQLISAKGILNRYNLSYQTLNHYTDFGLLPVSQKVRNQRFYDRKLVDRRIKQILTLKREGYSLRLIRKKLIGF